ncbi:MAG: SMP-30/gluconolactonase/LRE family protein [Sediminibacterium sp.]|nr:SMP-30/gluconolactonase/LRE family protein [Sediminibacterium sp.]MDP3127128.1 SMP-30/gluconolactonase/LRE family protein [Sediminibacterium sp.]MDP3666197.1 SMP-30/gluconolactonase/LRE family protein [Sediminibacterium sp.]
MNATNLFHARNDLGESACWFAERNSFFWTDITASVIYEIELSTSKVTKRNVAGMVSLILPESKNTALLLMQDGIYRYFFATDITEKLMEVEAAITNNRTNDGDVDSTGRVWFGTMDNNCRKEAGSFYSADTISGLQHKLSNMTIPNGIAWTADNRIMYHVESARNEVRAWNFDSITGDIHFKETVIKVPSELGSPDGMCMDTEGMLWIAHYGGFGVYRWNPETGLLMDKISLPVPQPTSCAFGGENMDRLLITTAKQELTTEQLTLYPESGDIFIVTPGCTGMVKHRAKL